MVRKSIIMLVAVMPFCASAVSQQAQRNPAGKTAFREIIPGHYAFSSGSFNSGIIATSEGVVVLDALNSAAVGKVERETITNTIHDPVRFLRRERVPADEQRARLPDETYRDRITLYLGGKEIQVLFLGRGHTRGDSIIYVPQDRIVYLSELFFAGQFLYIDDGYGLDWLKTLDAVDTLSADIFVPAHGPIPADPRDTRQELGRFRQMLVGIRDAVQQEVARGATEDQAVAAVRWPQYEKMQGYNAEREVAVRRLYQQLTGALR